MRYRSDTILLSILFEEIKQYYFDIIEATQNNMIIYAIPDLTGVNISIEQFGELFNHEKL